MPSSISDFNLTTRALRPALRVDLALDGTVEAQTNYLDNFTILETVEGVAGIKEMTLDADLFVPAPSENWGKKGRTVEADMSISSDSWSTTHTEELFRGSTTRQNTVPIRDVKVKATSYNSDYLDKKASRQVFVNQDIAYIMQSLLEEVGVDPADISLSSTGITLPAYVISDNVPIREYIQDLALGALQVVGFDREGIFTASTLVPVDFSGAGYTPDLTVDLDTTLEFRSRDVEGRYYCNRLIGRGARLVYLQDTQLDFAGELTGYEVAPNEKLYVRWEIPDTVPLEIYPFTAVNSGNLLNSFGFKPQSFFAFYEADDGSGDMSNTSIVVETQSIVRDGDKDILFLIFRNDSGVTKYLRTLLINGSAVQKVADLYESRDNSGNIAEDGKETVYEISSNAIQNDVQLGNVLNTLQLNLWEYQNVYTFTISGRPQIKLGTIIQFNDVTETTLTGVVCEIDSEVSIDSGYTQELTVKILAEPADYFELDNASIGLDDSNYQLF